MNTVCDRMHTHVHVRSETGCQCLPQSFSTLFFFFLTRTSDSASLAAQKASGICLSFLASTGVRVYAATPAFTRTLVSKPESFCLDNNSCSNRAIFPASKSAFGKRLFEARQKLRSSPQVLLGFQYSTYVFSSEITID